MKANINMHTTVKSGSFSYVRKPVTVEAYGEKFDLPVKTVEFCDKLDGVTSEMLKNTKTSDSIHILKKGISLFIGEEKTEQLFPENKIMTIEFDEIFGFWAFLKHEQNAQQRELIAQYR